MNKKIILMVVSVGMSFFQMPAYAEDTVEKKYDVRGKFAAVMKAAQSDDYIKALKIIKEVTLNTSGTFHLRALHVQMDIHRILGQWDQIPALVDNFMFKYKKDEQAQKNTTWDAHRMSEKYAAEVALGKIAAAVESSKKALSYYDELSQTWTVNDDGAWVSKITNQVCPMIWHGHILYDAYNEKNGDSSCQYWDSKMFGGISLRIYKTTIAEGVSAVAQTYEEALNNAKTQKIGEFNAIGGESMLVDQIPSTYAIKSYEIGGRAAQKGLIIAKDNGGWRLNMMYSKNDRVWASKSLKKIWSDLK